MVTYRCQQAFKLLEDKSSTVYALKWASVSFCEEFSHHRIAFWQRKLRPWRQQLGQHFSHAGGFQEGSVFHLAQYRSIEGLFINDKNISNVKLFIPIFASYSPSFRPRFITSMRTAESKACSTVNHLWHCLTH